MSSKGKCSEVIRKALTCGDLRFSDFMELALYHPECGYYMGPRSPVGKEGDYVTSVQMSPAFSFALGQLVAEFLARSADGPSTIVDIGCGDGALIHSLWSTRTSEAAFFGVDRSLERVAPHARAGGVRFVRDLTRIPREGSHLILSNELFDALPFTRLVMRGEHLHELWVTETSSGLDWIEREASPVFEDYFAGHGIELTEGQFADVAVEWRGLYEEMCGVFERGLIVSFDYGFPARQLFHPRARRFGTAASYRGQRVHRDLLANPGEQDLTAHINFTDLIEGGESKGLETLFFDRQSKFLLALGITRHPLFGEIPEQPRSVGEALEHRDAREEARSLVLPDGIGHDIRVLVQAKGCGDDAWSFQRPLF